MATMKDLEDSCSDTEIDEIRLRLKDLYSELKEAERRSKSCKEKEISKKFHDTNPLR